MSKITFKLRAVLLVLLGVIATSKVSGQTVTFKPGPVIGQDAMISIGHDSTYATYAHWENTNNGNNEWFYAQSWTWNTHPGTIRSLLRFDELSTIPIGATIISAELKLYGIPSFNWHGNSSYPGSPYNDNSWPLGNPLNTTNPSSLYKVMSAWSESTVTWNTQPSIDPNPIIRVPITTSQFNWNFTTNWDINNSTALSNMVKYWVDNPSDNFGFMMQLDVEGYYRCVVFASSDHPDSTLWPELTVTYCIPDTIVIYNTDTIVVHNTDTIVKTVVEYIIVEVEKPCPCESDFSYMSNSAYPNTYSFMASNSAVKHEWIINGMHVSSANAFIYTFPAGQHKVCYARYSQSGKDGEVIRCEEKCITICVEKDPVYPPDGSPPIEKENSETVKPNEEKKSEDVMATDASKIKIYPNPTANTWTVEITSEKEELVQIQLSDMNGKKIYSTNKVLNSGYNSFVIDANNLAIANYSLQIIGNTTQFIENLLKQ
jgi:hypothetical protein